MDTGPEKLPTARPGPASGEILGGKYRLIRALGEGGMGAVFEAENLVTLRRAAVKWLHPRLAPNALAQQRMLREARATSRIRHRNVVDLYDVVLEQDAVVLVMELLTGEVMSERLQRETTSLLQLVRWLIAAMEGVVAAHAVDVIHRDIKPANIFLARVGDEIVPKVIDFGISKVVETDASRLTHSGVAMGTPRYMSFEQLRCDPSLDARSDVYAFGVILYEALVGRAPYEGSSFGEQAVEFITRDPALPRALRAELPEALSSLVFRAISREREQRQASMAELVEELRPFSQERSWPEPLLVWEGPAALPDGVLGMCSTQRASLIPSRVPRPPRAKKKRWPVAVFVCVLGALTLWPRASSDSAPPPPVRIQQPVAFNAVPPSSALDTRTPVHHDVPTPVVDAGVPRARVTPRRTRVQEDVPAGSSAPPAASRARAHRAGPVARDEF
ncbi:MAG: serine/threonine-protein kinase [Polyangiales bacterium]